MRTLILGAGISGLTAAAALGRKGFQVELAELKPQVSDGGGVGLTLTSNALRALDHIGVAQACVAAGIASDTIAMCRPDGQLMFDNPGQRLGGWPGGVGITRSAFHAILVEAATAGGAILHCALTAEDWRDDGEGLEVRFSDGRTGRYDLMVAADGLYSRTRARILPDCTPALTGQAVWRAETPRPEPVRRTHMHLGGPHGMVGVCPVAEDRSYLYIVEAAPDNPWRDPATLHLQMQAMLAGYGGLVAELAATLDRPDKVSYRPLEWLLAPRPWGEGRVVLIGDAAHANPPVLAQGAAMGIEDAIVLAEELASASDVPAALARFIDRRYPRAAGVVEASCQLARWEVEHTPNVDVPGVMRRAAEALAAAP